MMAAIALGALALMGATPLLAFLRQRCSAWRQVDEPRRQSCPCAHFTARLGGFYFLGQAVRHAGRRCARRYFVSVACSDLGLAERISDHSRRGGSVPAGDTICGLDDDTEITVNEPDPSQAGGAFESLRLSLATRRIAATSMACMFFAGSQVALIAFLVVYLWQIGVMSVAQAGMAFSLFHASGVAARLVFGWFAERLISSFALLVFSACGMAVSLIALASFSTEWSLRAMFAVIAFAGCTGNGWVGLLFAELARLAPEGKTADVTSGAQVFMYAGVFVTPLACSAALDLTGGDYDAVFAILTCLAVAAAALLEWGRRGTD